MTLDEIQIVLVGVSDSLNNDFAGSNPGRLEQFDSALESVLMAAGYLFTEVPYRS